MIKRQLTLLDDTNIAETTKATYRSYFDSLFKWAAIKTQEEFLRLTDDQLQETLEGFVRYLIQRVKNNEISPNTVPKLFKPYKLLLDANYREHAVKWKPISIKYPPMEKRSGYKPWKTSHIEEFLGKCKNYKEEAAIHFQASTGSRVGVHNHPLLMKHITKMEIKDSDYHSYAVLIYAESDETIEEKDQRILDDQIDENDYSFFVFLTPEASRSLDKYHEYRVTIKHEVLTPNTPIFVSEDRHNILQNGKYYQMSGNAYRKMFQKILRKTNVKRTKKRNRYDTMIDHAYRKRFNTILKLDNSVNSNIAEKLMQHKKGLDGTYLTPTREECFAEFVKAIPQLTINPAERQKQKITEQQMQITELEKQKKTINELQQKDQDMETKMQMVLDELERYKHMVKNTA